MAGLVSEIYKLLLENGVFILVNYGSHIAAGVLIATILYPFLGNNFKKRANYVVFVMVPAIFASTFADHLFILSSLIKHRSIDGLRIVLEDGGAMHSVFHTDIALLLVIPSTVFLVMMVRFFLGYIRENTQYLKKVKLVKKWVLWVSILSLVCALIHLVMDFVGF
ncbi:hypothetical protein ACFLZX_02395 [Nanoarchaeota archaeon]